MMPAQFPRRLVLATLASPMVARAQTWPDRPVRIVSPYPPGGSTDALARLVAEGLRRRFGQPFVVENRPGAGGAIGHNVVAQAAPDGTTLLLSAAGPLAVTPHTTARLPYDALHAFAPIKLVASSPLLLLVRPGTSAEDVRGLVALSHQRPGGLSYASFGIGSSAHLCGEMFRVATAATLVHIPYNGSGPAVAGLLAGDTDLMFEVLASGLPHVQGGRLRALAVTSAERSPFAPEVPTMQDQGVAGFEAGTWFGLLAPAGTPEPIITTLDRAMDTIMAEDSFHEALKTQFLLPMGGPPARFAQFLAAEYEKWGQAARAAGIQPS
jgi:tripartite-type tricarboxylate transporter receptor subunit TctC